jgi:tetratricopeptide (TPR) repeat protein
MTLLCQSCGAPNSEGRERCIRCGTKLLIVSGASEEGPDNTEEMFFEAQEELEEHLLERITALEEGVRQLSSAIAATAERTAQIEHNLTVTHAGVEVLGDLLETRSVLSRAEINDGWERFIGQELLNRDLSRRFRERSSRILSHAEHTGRATTRFRRQLRALELALLGRQNDLAQDLLAELAHLAPDNDELWSFIGEAAFETGDLDSARVAFRRVLELRGPHFDTLIYLGTILSDLGEWDEAEAVLQQATAMAPGSFLPRFTLGALEVVRGRHERAQRHLRAALEIEELPQVWHLLGVCDLQLKRPGRAIKALRRAVELAPHFEDALYQLGIAYIRRGWSRLALETFEQVLRLDPQRLQYQETVRMVSLKPPRGLAAEAATRVHQAEAALEQGRPKAALGLLESAIVLAPDEPGLRATAALLASSLGESRRALRHAHLVLRRPPADSPYVTAAVVAVLESLRHASRELVARRLARRFYRDGPDPLSRALAAYELALVESELGSDLEEARTLALEALEITPRELRHYPLAALGEIALKRGRFREAVTYLEQAADAAPTPTLLRQLAVARLAAGDTEGAEEALEAADSQPGRGLDEELLGHVHRLGTLLGGTGHTHRTTRNRGSGG